MYLGYCAKNKCNHTACYIQNPSHANRGNKTAISKALYPKSESETTPCANKVFSGLPKEYCERAAHDTSNGGGQYEHALECVARWVDRGKNAELDDKNETDQ